MRKRWRAFPLPPHGLTAADGAALLREDPGGAGVVLWDLARDVLLWADATPAEMDGLFPRDGERLRLSAALSALDADLPWAATSVLAALSGAPHEGRRGVVAVACAQVASWAERRGALGAAYAFAVGAAHACPMDGAHSYLAGRIARRRAEYARAGGWLKRAILLARQNEDWETYARGLSGLANSYAQRGSYPRARKYNLRFLRASREHELRTLEAEALHGLCDVAIQVGDMAGAHHFAQVALDAYRSDHPKLRLLAHDVAYAWMTAGCFSAAQPIFEHLLPVLPEHEITVLANLSRAAAGSGDRVRYASAWRQAWEQIATLDEQHVAPEVLLELARAAAMMAQWEMAEQASLRALQVAAERREARVQLAAEAILASIRSEQVAGASSTTSPDPELVAEAEALSQSFVRSFAPCAG